MSGKKINNESKKMFLKKLKVNISDVPYKDFKGPF